MSRSRRSRKKRRFSDGDEISPLNGLSNLSDAMLVLALGILVALVVHWNVNIVPANQGNGQDNTTVQTETSGGENQIDRSAAAEFSEEDLQKAGADEAGSGEGLERMGTVYYDEATGKYYVVDDSSSVGEESGTSLPEGSAGGETEGQ